MAYVDEDYFSETSPYSAPFTVTDADELARVLERSSADVDRLVGQWRPVYAGDPKFGDLTANPQGLEAGQVTALKDAVCAQALWRITQGHEWFVGSHPRSVSGPDFSTTGQPARTSPEAMQILQGAGLLRLTGRCR